MNPSEARVIIAANPKSGGSPSGELVAQLRREVETRGYPCDILTDLAMVRSEAERLADQGKLRAVVSAGGDGTADALANLLSSEAPIVLFPLGTENLLAKHFGITKDVQQACQTIETGVRYKMDVGSANGTLFLVMASCGYDAEVVRQMHSIRTGHISRFSYFRPILRALRKYRFAKIPFRLLGEPNSPAGAAQEMKAKDLTAGKCEEKCADSAAWIFVFNVPRYAAALEFCPQADPVDGQLDVCTFERGGIGFGLGYLARLFARSHQSMRGFRHHRCKEILIESPVDRSGAVIQDVPFQVDGDPGGVLPVSIKVLPQRLTLLVPSAS